MTSDDKIELFRLAIFYSGGAFVVGALFGFVVGLGVKDDG